MTKPVVLCTLPLPEPFPSLLEGRAELRILGRVPSADELIAEVTKGVDVLCPQLRDQVTEAVLVAGGDRLRAVCTYAVGHNNIDVAAASRLGIQVCNTPGVLTDATADCAFALLLAAARRIVEGDALMRAGEFGGWEPGYLLGLELRDALLGVVGFGRIGQAVARRALAFGMRVAYTGRESVQVEPDLVGRVTAMSFDALVSEADVLTLHVPLNDQTRHLINADVLRRMKSTAVLVNTARGPVVDEAALVIALNEGWIAAAGLDVYEAEPAMAAGLAACRNAVLAPHLGSATVRTRTAMADLVARNTLAVLRGETPPHCVNVAAITARR